MTGAYRKAVYAFCIIVIVIGAALLVQTARNGGGSFGFVLGALFVGLGAGRLTILRKMR